jgi:hypothetical protein
VINENLENMNIANYKKLKSLEERGVSLSTLEKTLLFYKRQYGKSFMSYCSIMLAAEELDNSFSVTLTRNNRVEIEPEHDYKDPDLGAPSIKTIETYIKNFEVFLKEYYPDYKITKTKHSLLGKKPEAVVQKEYFSIEQCSKNPNFLYVFGDNTLRVGKAGQAQIRDCPNSIGICTKRLPSISEEAYFTDSKSDWEIIKRDLDNLRQVSGSYDRIIFPYDGLGTGLSDMPNKCPKLFLGLSKYLKRNYNFNNRNENV